MSYPHSLQLLSLLWAFTHALIQYPKPDCSYHTIIFWVQLLECDLEKWIIFQNNPMYRNLVHFAISLFSFSLCMHFMQRHLKATNLIEEKWVILKGSAIATDGNVISSLLAIVFSVLGLWTCFCPLPKSGCRYHTIILWVQFLECDLEKLKCLHETKSHVGILKNLKI